MTFRQWRAGSCQVVRSTFCLLALLSLTHCASLPPPDTSESASDPVADAALQRQKTQRLVGDLLWQAERAFRAGRLSLPHENNALDRYRAVLVLQPGNAAARAGIDNIVVRYAQLARDAIAAGAWSQANGYIRRSLNARPGNALALLLERELDEARQQRRNPYANSAGEVRLDADDLSGDETRVPAVLIEIVERLRRTGETILIVARSDGEGRRLYGQLRAAAEGFRIRGDIRVGSEVKIVFLPPM